MTDTQAQLTRLALYCSAAIGYAVTGYATKVHKDPDVTFQIDRFAKTLVVGLAAGLIMASRGDDANPETYAAAAAIAIPIVDKLLNSVLDAR